MSSSMVVHDKRLQGTAPAIAPNIYKVNEHTPIRNAFHWISSYARSNGGLTDLYVMCHGYEGLVYDSRTAECAGALGFGLQLCREGLTFSTLTLSSQIRDLVSVIWLYACGPANTREGFSGTSADGRQFCRELAAHTNADVIAASRTQWYHQRGPNRTIDFGNWEGEVYRFSPDGSVSRHY